MKTNNINITSKISPALQQKLSLKPGQIIKAQVVQSEGKQVLLQLGNNILKAQAKVPLNTGDSLALQVESVRDQTIELKLVQNAVQMNPEDKALVKLGIKPQPEMYMALRQLVNFNLPVSQSSVLELYNLIHEYKSNEALIRMAAWLKTVGIKVESEKDFLTLQTLHKFLKHELPVDNEERLFSFLNDKESMVFGGCNIFGWPIAGQHVFLLTPESKREQLRPENCRLVLQLNSTSLKEIWVKLQLNRNTLRTGIVCSEHKYKAILSREARGLGEALQAAGYNVTAIDIEVSPSKLTILDFISQPTPHLHDVNYQV